MRIAITGSTGLVGIALTRALQARGTRVCRVRRLSPSPPLPPAACEATGEPNASEPDIDSILWDPGGTVRPPHAFSGCDAVVHLAGASVGDRRWNAARKFVIDSSRRRGTRTIVDALAAADPRPSLFVCASGVGYYGDRGDAWLDETSNPGDGFLAEVVQAWEAEARRATDRYGIRTIRMRVAPVLSAEGGMLARVLPVFRWGIGGRLGSGKQFMSWVHIDDLIAFILLALDDASLDGAYNVTAPVPVTNAEFTRVLARVVRRPAPFVAPAFALRLAYGQMADEVLLTSQRVRPGRLIDELGFEFAHPTLEAALRCAVRQREHKHGHET